jgi:hypothetical protein
LSLNRKYVRHSKKYFYELKNRPGQLTELLIMTDWHADEIFSYPAVESHKSFAIAKTGIY